MINMLPESVYIKMNKCILIFVNDLKKIRTNRTSPDLLNSICIDYYGVSTPLLKLANIVVDNNNVLKIILFDSSIQKNVEKAITNSNLGLNPISKNSDILVHVPHLTESRRKDLIKIIRHDAENARIFIRNIRRDANDQVKNMLKKKEINKDVAQDTKKDIQKHTNFFIKKINDLNNLKEKELLTI